MKNQTFVLLLLRLSIASVFLYAAVAATLAPDNWIGYFPSFLTKTFPAQPLLLCFSLYELLLSLWILTGWKNFLSASLSALTLLGIISANIGDMDVLFRDFAILFAALALAAATYEKKNGVKKSTANGSVRQKMRA